MQNNQQLIEALRSENLRLKQENLMLKNLSTTQGFFDHYYSLLPKHKTFKAAFEEANNDYYQLYGRYKYSNVKSFNNTKPNKCKK